MMVTHHYKLDDITATDELVAHRRDGVLKLAIKPHWRAAASAIRADGASPSRADPIDAPSGAP